MLKLFCLSLLVGGLSAAHNVVKKSGNVGAAGAPPYPLWHLEPLYVKKLPAKSEEKREAASPVSRSEMEESHSVFTDINGERNSLQQQIQKGAVTSHCAQCALCCPHQVTFFSFSDQEREIAFSSLREGERKLQGGPQATLSEAYKD